MEESKRKSYSEIFGAEQKGMHSFGNSIFTAPYSAKGKKRDFKGASRYGYGPVNAPKVVDTDTTGTNSGMIGTLGYGTANDPVSYGGAGDAGSAMGESVNELKTFIDSYKDINPKLVESIQHGLKIIFENITDDVVQLAKDNLQREDVLALDKGVKDLPEGYVYNPMNVEDGEDSIDNQYAENELDEILNQQGDDEEYDRNISDHDFDELLPDTGEYYSDDAEPVENEDYPD